MYSHTPWFAADLTVDDTVDKLMISEGRWQAGRNERQEKIVKVAQNINNNEGEEDYLGICKKPKICLEEQVVSLELKSLFGFKNTFLDLVLLHGLHGLIDCPQSAGNSQPLVF